MNWAPGRDPEVAAEDGRGPKEHAGGDEGEGGGGAEEEAGEAGSGTAGEKSAQEEDSGQGGAGMSFSHSERRCLQFHGSDVISHGSDVIIHGRQCRDNSRMAVT